MSNNFKVISFTTGEDGNIIFELDGQQSNAPNEDKVEVFI